MRSERDLVSSRLHRGGDAHAETEGESEIGGGEKEGKKCASPAAAMYSFSSRVRSALRARRSSDGKERRLSRDDQRSPAGTSIPVPPQIVDLGRVPRRRPLNHRDRPVDR